MLKNHYASSIVRTVVLSDTYTIVDYQYL